MDAFATSLFVGFGIIFLAELGDKSQLLAMTFASRYRPLPILVGITLATTVVHGISVGLGHGVGANLPRAWVAAAAGVAFLGFAAWTLRGDSLSDAERSGPRQTWRSAVIAVSVAFFLAELGDKTMLATVTLAAQHGWLGTWIGSTLGMVAADALAIAVGHQLAKRVPEHVIRYVAAATFAGVGLWLLVDALGELL